MKRHAAAAMVALVLAAGCASGAGGSDAGPQPPPSASATDNSPNGGNGTLYTAVWDADLTITSYPIDGDGSIGPAREVLSEPAGDSSFPGLIDGLGALALTGTFDEYWTTAVQVRRAGEVTDELAVRRWCGGEGLTFAPCVLLDDTRLARTTALGRDPMSGEGPTQGSIIVSSLTDGTTLAEYGPVDDLTAILGTGSADELLLVTTEFSGIDEPAGTSTVLRMDLTDGTTTEVGTSPGGWAPLCPIGADSVLGFVTADTSDAEFPRTVSTAATVGPQTVADIRWDDQDAVGCSADGRFLYLHHYPQPPTGENDTEPPNPPTSVERIMLADGTTESVLVLDPGVQVVGTTR